MTINSNGGRSFSTRLGFVALLGVGGFLGFWAGMTYSAGERWVPAVMAVLPAAMAVIWLFGARSQERLQAVWNNYADREIARTPHVIRQPHSRTNFSRRNIHARPQPQAR